MKNALLLFALLAIARLSSAQNPADSCYFWIQPSQTSGGTWLIPQTPDSNNMASIIWNTGSTNYIISVNAPGFYCATVTMNDGCTSENCINWQGAQPCSVEIYEDSTGTLSAGTSNTIWPLLYHWSTGAGTQNIPSGGPGLIYCVTIVDGTGCTASDCITTTYGNCSVWISTQFDSLSSQLSLSANAFGGSPVNYIWSTGETSQTITVAPNAGQISVTISDALGCSATDSTVVDFGSNCNVVAIQSGNLLWADFSGFGSATFLWSSGETSQVIYPQTSGTYCVTATNALGCTATACQLFIGNPPPGCQLSASVLPDVSSGHYRLTAVPKNGTEPYVFHWKYGDNNQFSAIGQSPVIYYSDYFPYQLTVTDANGCTATAEFSDANCMISMNYEVDPGGSGKYRVNISPTGTGFVWYSTNTGWVGGGTGNGLHGILADNPGTFCVTLTDEIGCQQDACIELPECSVSLAFQPDSSISASFYGGQPTSIVWSNPALSGLNVNPNFAWNALAVHISDGVCMAVDTIYANPVDNLPQQVFIQKALIQPDGVRLIALATQPENVVVYTWNLGVQGREVEVNVGGTYCVTAFYANGRSATNCIELEQSTNIDIKVGFGIVGQQDQRFGNLWLIEHDPSGGTLTAVDTVPFNASLGVFENVPPGQYLLKASVGEQSVLHPNYIPTYWASALLWNDARPLNFTHPFGQNFVFLPLRHGQNPGGPGFVGGLVSQGANLQAGDATEFFGGNPMPGVCILLTLPDGTPVAHSVTDEFGKFEFPNLAYGTYQVWVDIPGLGPVFKEVSIGPANPSVSTLSILVDGDSAAFAGTTSAPETAGFSALEIFPNPSSGLAFLSLEKFSGEQIRVLVFNPLGQTVFEKSPQNLNEPVLTLDVSGYSEGQYFVVVENGEGGRVVGKFCVRKN